MGVNNSGRDVTVIFPRSLSDSSSGKVLDKAVYFILDDIKLGSWDYLIIKSINDDRTAHECKIYFSDRNREDNVFQLDITPAMVNKKCPQRGTLPIFSIRANSVTPYFIASVATGATVENPEKLLRLSKWRKPSGELVEKKYETMIGDGKEFIVSQFAKRFDDQDPEHVETERFEKSDQFLDVKNCATKPNRQCLFHLKKDNNGKYTTQSIKRTLEDIYLNRNEIK